VSHVSALRKFAGHVCAGALFLFALASGARAETALSAPVFGHPDGRGIPVTMDGYSLAMTGTGFFVSKEGHFLTPFHVAGGCIRRAVLRPEGAYEATAVAMYAHEDIAVMKSAAPHTTAELAPPNRLPVGTPFVIVRYYHLGGMASRSAVAARYLGTVDLRPIDFAVRAAEPVVGGNSGSPVVRLDGGVAAMVTAITRENAHVALGIDSHVLAQALQTAGVPFRWLSKKIAASPAAGNAAAAGLAMQFTFPIACYVAPKP